MRQVPYLLMVILLATGCAFGNQHDYHRVQLSLDYEGESDVGVATIDQRPYVVSGEKPPDFVGLQRGGWGNPFDVTTASGNPLAKDMTTTVVESLSSHGFKATRAILPSVATPGEVRKYIEKNHPYRLLLITLFEWKSDSYNRTALIYNLDFQVFDDTGKLLTTKNASGSKNLGGSFWNPPAHAKSAIPTAFKVLFEQQLNESDVSGALK